MISKKLKQLKSDRDNDNDFDTMKKALIDAGIFKNQNRKKGEVVYWSKQRGFGFLRCKERKKYFLHCSEVSDRKPPEVGEQLEFEAGPDRKARKAIKSI